MDSPMLFSTPYNLNCFRVAFFAGLIRGIYPEMALTVVCCPLNVWHEVTRGMEIYLFRGYSYILHLRLGSPIPAISCVRVLLLRSTSNVHSSSACTPTTTRLTRGLIWFRPRGSAASVTSVYLQAVSHLIWNGFIPDMSLG